MIEKYSIPADHVGMRLDKWVKKNAKTQVWALTVNYKPLKESPPKLYKARQASRRKGSKQAKVKAASEQK